MTRDHRIHRLFGEIDGELAVAGRPVSTWITEAGGSTPLFIYDRAIIAATLAELRAALPPDVGVHYAVKANPLPELVRWMVSRVDGIDVASGGELQLALAAGASAAQISFAGPGKRETELEAAIAAGATLNIESAGEFARAAAIGRRIGRRLHAAVRVNPPFEVKASGMRMGGGAKPFGVDAEQVPELLASIADAGSVFKGFHVFAGSQNLSAEALIEAQRMTLELVAELAVHAPCPPPLVNMGGGFGIPYFPDDKRLDVGMIGKALAGHLARRAKILRDTKFVIELGRYLVGDCGVYLTRVVDRKSSGAEIFLVTDGGLHHQLAATGNFGAVIKRNYPVVNASRFSAEKIERANVVGCLCTPLDRIADRIDLPVTGTGDVIAVFMAGAYGLSASPVRFLGHDLPSEIVA